MADDQFEARENAYYDNLGATVGRFCTAIVEADSMAKDAHSKRLLQLMAQPNAEFEAVSSLIGIDEDLSTRISVPQIVITQTNPIEIESAVLSLDMSVSASNTDTLSIGSKVGTDIQGSIGFGPFKASVSVQAEMSVSKETKRQSDYRSTTHAEVSMRQAAVPEGIALIVDCLNANTKTALDISRAMAQAQLPAMADAAAPEPLPPPDDE